MLGPVGALLALPAAATAQGLISATGERYAIEEGPLTRLSPEHERRANPRPVATLPQRDEDELLEGTEELDETDGIEEEE